MNIFKVLMHIGNCIKRIVPMVPPQAMCNTHLPIFLKTSRNWLIFNFCWFGKVNISLFSLHFLDSFKAWYFFHIWAIYVYALTNLGLCVFSFKALLFFIKILFIYYQREGKGGRKRGRETSMCERHMDWLPLTGPPQRTWTGNLGMCPDWESNWWLDLLSHTSQG